jgi:lipoprotein signal peptidase
MKPSPARRVIRESTAYSAGRAVVDIFLALSLVGTAIVVWWFFTFSNQETWAVIYLSSAIAGLIFNVILREALHALFDLADCNLRDVRSLE